MRADLTAIKENIFRGAHETINWERFPWHRWAHRPRSSQALAIDVFGTIKARPGPERSRILAGLAERCGLPPDGTWKIVLEWRAPRAILNEPRPTQVDVLAIGKHALLVIECKFTEPGGSCSQTLPRDGSVRCSGKYQLPRNSVTNHRCALTAKGVSYWAFIPETFGIDASTDHLPCPFAGESYQWMRNLVLAKRLSVDHGKSSAVVAAFADAVGLHAADKARERSLGPAHISGAPLVFPISYQAIIDLARSRSDRADLWDGLAAWVSSKISAIGR